MERRKDRKKGPDDFDPLHSIAVASGAGLTILVSIGVGLWLGLKCDEYLGTSPLGVILLSILGAMSGMYSVIKQILGKK
ncbi:AtpZ/AtpI family protein [Dialister sp.]|uniref:AtpZ/AtpI family protein n=1 Tax=Dialister sp. TaxID=1955814 RepID=UPI003EFC512E